ncbi:MAG: hypothetical protein KAR43_04125 [Deltaproteobacteria bacterium]|nr:hypothetical protein [Deltaproteobacteria bacterium]
MTFSVVALLIFWSAESTLSAELSHGDRILATAQKMISVIESVEDFICDAEVIYYRDGEEDKRYRITFYYKQMGKIRVKFSHPERYHEALGNVTPADVYYGRDQEKKARREQIRKKTMRLRRAQNCSLRLV